jgi:hypothetical protein
MRPLKALDTPGETGYLLASQLTGTLTFFRLKWASFRCWLAATRPESTSGETTCSVKPSGNVQSKPLTVTEAHESNLAPDLSGLFLKECSAGDLARQVLDL